MDVISKEIRNEELWELLYVEDLVITAENEEDQEGGCEAEVDSSVKAAWGKWREVAGIVSDKEAPIKLKVKIYSTVIRIGNMASKKFERTEMRMLRWIMGILLLERLKNDEIRRKTGLVRLQK
ncbi:uncharacterized protein LOC135211495 [Macrobrachium nipponense]|uniref:uncharacterized protein LOC135211495 n=1 Tax=Macrobrachium nipponense TaxID=159736 RepID=UPI0030C80AF3